MYTVLDTTLNVVGFLSNKGRGANDFWGDTISQQIADTQDILGNVDLTVDNVSRNIDVSGNTKNWNHTLSGISFNNTPVGAQVENGYYLLYKDDATNRHYLMQLTSVLEKVTPGGQHYKTATGVNAALYDFSRMIVDAKEFYSAPTGTQTLGSLQNILKYLLGHAGWNVNLEDYNFPDVQYSISDNTSVQSVLQDIIKLFDVDVDAYVTLTPQGRLAKRVVEFRRTMGTDSGVTIRYGKNMTDMTREALSDSIYTKLYVQGANGLKISSVNNGLPYIVDEAANKRYNPVGASSSPETFREGTVINSMITDARSLLAWGKKQLQALNHPRINYTISSIASTEAGLGDTIRVQDLYASQQILLTSRVIQKTFSFANPTTNTLVLGEYSSVIGDKTKNVDLIAKLGQVADDITVVSEAAVKTQVVAEGAASIASQAISAASSAATHANAAEDALSSAFNTAKSDVARLYSENKADTASHNSFVTEQLATTNKMVEDAKSSAIGIGQTTAQNAQKALDEAKKDFTSSFASQASQTASMASDVTSKASQYASQAKSEAVAVATSADGVVRTEFKSTTDSMTATIQKNKSDADGKISTAQTTATQALDGLSTKVSQTEYNAKTGQLQTDLTTTTQTANQAATDIVSIKQKDGEQDEKMNSIVSDVNGTKQTISDLQTTQGKQSGDIATLQSRADGFEATVTKVNNLAVGGRNLLQGTGTASGDVSNGGGTFVKGAFNGYDAVKTNTAWNERYINLKSALGRTNAKAGDWYTISVYVKADKQIDTGSLGVYRALGNGDANTNDGFIGSFQMSNKPITTQWQQYSWSFQINNISLQRQSTRVEYSSATGDNWIYWAGWVLEKGTIATDWTPAPEDVSSATAQAQLTADNATLAITNYKTDADGRISKAQADIITNANAITQKVSQSDYNAKTGELTNSVSKAQQTADTATQTIGNYKETNDKRVTAAETDIKANSDAILQTVSKTDFDKATGKLSGDISTLQQRADGFDATITKVNNLAVGGRNLLTNTNKDVSITSHTTDGWPAWANIDTGFSFENGKTYTFSAEAKNSTDKIAEASIRVFEASTNTQVGIYVFPADGKRHSVNFTIPNDSHNYHLLFYAGHAGIAPGVDLTTTYHHPKLEAGNIATDWTPAPEDVDSNIAQVKLTADGLYEKVNNPTTGIATRLLTAEGTITTVQDKTNELTSKLTQTASAIQASVETKTDKSTVLQLFSDNFEAGIKANTGALIAGINADTSGTTIAGKHITLDGSVTVTGAFVSKALSTADATITKVLTIGAGGSIVNTYTKSGTFTGYSGQVSYSLSGKFTFNNSGISFGGTAKGPSAPTSTSGEVSQRGIPFVPTQWNASSVVNEALMQMSATAVKGYSVKSDVLASGDSSYLNLSAFNIQLNSGGYNTYIGPDMIMTDGQVQASAFTAMGTSYFKNIKAGVVDSGPIRLNNAHTIFTTDGTTLYLAGGAQGGGAGVQVTDNFTVKGDMSVGTVNAGGNINVGWDVIKNGTGLHPDYFNNALPGIHIMGTNSGIAWDIKNKLAYIIIENSYKGLGNNNTGTGKWKN